MARQTIAVPASVQLSYEISRGEHLVDGALYETASIAFFVAAQNTGKWEVVQTFDKAAIEPMPDIPELSEALHATLSNEKCPFTQIDLAQFDEVVDAALNEFTLEHSSLSQKPLPESLAQLPRSAIDKIIR